jgi:hypothetical protein
MAATVAAASGLWGVPALAASYTLDSSSSYTADTGALSATNVTDKFSGISVSKNAAIDDAFTFTLSTASKSTTLNVLSTTKNLLAGATLTLYEVNPNGSTTQAWSGQTGYGKLAGSVISATTTVATTLSSGTYRLVVLENDPSVSGTYGGSVHINPVPIPGAVVLFGSGLMGLLALSRRRAIKTAA